MPICWKIQMVKGESEKQKGKRFYFLRCALRSLYCIEILNFCYILFITAFNAFICKIIIFHFVCNFIFKDNKFPCRLGNFEYKGGLLCMFQ